MAGGSWDPLVSAVRPGLYINFVNAAIQAIAGGPKGVVAIPLKSHVGGTAADKTFYEVENEKQASDLFGLANIQSIKWALQGKCSKVLVYTMPSAPAAQDYVDMRAAFDSRPFNVFVFDGEVSSSEQSNTKAWQISNRTDGKHFLVVYGGPDADDLDPTAGNARTSLLADDYSVNLISGVVISGTSYSSGDFAPFIAGLIAGTPINKSVTYQVPSDYGPAVADVTKRLTNAEIKTALTAGSLVLVNDGEKVRIERGLCASGKKIRKIRAEQAISTDVTKTANDNYIGKIDNNVDGQKALIAAVKSYLEKLADSNVLTSDITVTLHPLYESTGDSVYLLINVTEVDSMEEIYLEIQAG